MDICDTADEYMDAMMRARIADARSRTDSGLRPVGHCHWCGEPVTQSQLFCDSDCTVDYERARRP